MNKKLQRSKRCHWYYEHRLQMLSCSDCGILGYEVTSFAECLPALLGRWRQYFPPKYTHHCDTLHCPLPCYKNLKSHSKYWASVSFLSCVRTLLSLLFARIFCFSATGFYVDYCCVVGVSVTACIFIYLFITYLFIFYLFIYFYLFILFIYLLFIYFILCFVCGLHILGQKPDYINNIFILINKLLQYVVN